MYACKHWIYRSTLELLESEQARRRQERRTVGGEYHDRGRIPPSTMNLHGGPPQQADHPPGSPGASEQSAMVSEALTGLRNLEEALQV